MRNRPPYALASVDHALQLAALLQQEGPLRVTDAAERLGVAVSTAHRLLAMLVYRDFAEQGADRRYGPGKVLRPAEISGAPIALLRAVCDAPLKWLVEQTQESANVVVPARTEVRFIATVESPRVLRVGDRVGRSLPAHLTSGGKAILAALPPEEVCAMYEDAGEVDLPRLRRELALVRKRGFAINDQLTETGLTAIGTVVEDAEGVPLAGVSIALPTARFDRDALPAWVNALSTAARRVEAALADYR
ncbi:IclR family transcriptional regulator [Actinoallomurus iriomotensis]|uniref:IclR family transcriptional regulator n=1 Tax=Actinoallomurus iriomotensis TaxID=478107 RepID=A0A9W6S122_9ACTN|nr:IclR family transcriptional regulator [Actinoallomurus iriomotensis]GLY85474.1 IclR family transcriptional regulator [Actinoallomurus iriomotensis]